jgi:CBS domain containing-hemolysin-like protein
VSTFELLLVAIVVGLVVVAAVLACAETALSRVSRVRAQELVREERRGAASVLAITSDPARYVNVMLFLRSAAEVAAIVIASVVADSLLSPTWVAVATATGVMLVIAYVAIGVAPRTFGRQHAARVALLTAPVVRSLATFLAPLTRLLIIVGNAVTPGKGYREGPFATEAELRELVDLAGEDAVIEDDERQMIHSVFELGDTLVREVMVPRTEMVYIETGKNLRQALSLALRSGFSRIPVIGENLDDVVGVIYLKDAARRTNLGAEAASKALVETAMRPVLFVPDSKPVDELLRDMQSARVHMAVVVDEYGGTAGLVTIEDVLEEIVGEIADEYDVDETPPVEDLGDGRYRISTRLNVEDLGELLDVDIEEEDVDSVGGLLAKRIGKVPIAGSSVEVEGWSLTAESLGGRRNRVRTLLVAPVQTEASSADDAETRRPTDPAEHADV